MEWETPRLATVPLMVLIPDPPPPRLYSFDFILISYRVLHFHKDPVNLQQSGLADSDYFKQWESGNWRRWLPPNLICRKTQGMSPREDEFKGTQIFFSFFPGYIFI